MNILLDGSLHNDSRIYILAEVDHLISIVLKNDFDYILADIMDIALDGCKNDLPTGLG